MDLKITPEGDLAIENGELVWVTDEEAVIQHITFRLRTALGESPYNRLAGTPWLQVIFKVGTSIDSIRFILERRVAATPGVTSAKVNDLVLDRETRSATVSGEVYINSSAMPILFEIRIT